jgi:hypothetical protein
MPKGEMMTRRYVWWVVLWNKAERQKKGKGKGKKQLDSDEDSMRESASSLLCQSWLAVAEDDQYASLHLCPRSSWHGRMDLDSDASSIPAKKASSSKAKPKAKPKAKQALVGFRVQENWI